MGIAKHLKGTKEGANIWRQIVTTGNPCMWLNNEGRETFQSAGARVGKTGKN